MCLGCVFLQPYAHLRCGPSESMFTRDTLFVRRMFLYLDKSGFFGYSAGLFPGFFCVILSSLIRTAFLPPCHSCREGFSFSEVPIRNIYPTMNITGQPEIHLLFSCFTEHRTKERVWLASVYKGQHASNRVISVIFSVIPNWRTSSTPQSSALKSTEIPAVEVDES